MSPSPALAAVSAIIPCYRCTQTLERAVASVAAQTLRPAELILVDDGSGDGTRALLQSIAARYAPGWIKLVLLDQNVGAGSARNAGWAQASQPLIAFLDADDAWHFRKIEVQHAYMQAHPEVALVGHGYRLLKQDALPFWEVRPGIARPLSKLDMLLSNKIVTPSVMLYKDINHRFVPGQRYVDDHMLWLNIICTGGLATKLDVPLVAIYKDLFGVNGLSSKIWLMEQSELGNYYRLYKDKHLTTLTFLLLLIYSLLKYLRRLVIYTTYLRWKK